MGIVCEKCHSPEPHNGEILESAPAEVEYEELHTSHAVGHQCDVKPPSGGPSTLAPTAAPNCTEGRASSLKASCPDGTADPALKHAECIRHVLEGCRPPVDDCSPAATPTSKRSKSSAGNNRSFKGGFAWSKSDFSDEHLEAQSWHRWDTNGKLLIILRWVAAGTLRQHLGAVRDADVFEKLWGARVSDMSSQHGNGITLTRCIQKVPLIGKQTECITQRIFCNCLDDEELPCWVLSETTPAIPNFTEFSGEWYSFHIPAPGQPTRMEGIDGGRIFEPVGTDHVRITMMLSFGVPRPVQWLISDYLLGQIVKILINKGGASWADILSKWSASDFAARATRESHFYNAVDESVAAYLAKSGG